MNDVCYVGERTRQTMKGLAWALLAMYALTALFLLLWTCLCWKKYGYGQLSGYWKFFLHMWCKLQMVAFFFVLAVTQPCCVRAFLKQLYRISVSWDHALRVWIDNSLRGGHDYEKGMDRSLP